MKKIIVVLVVLLSVPLVRAQVIVAPTVLFMSDQSRFGTFVVMNRSNTPQEISISFRFGFPESDSLGNIRMQYDDTLMEEAHSCQNWLKGFPEKFILNPGQQQVVRLLAAAPPNIPDGEYWTRLVTSSTPQAKIIDTVKTGISANITFVLQQVTTVVYKQGAVNTTIELPDLSVKQDSASMDLYAHMSRGGNSPFLGRISAVVTDKAGNEVYSDEQIIAVYPTAMTIKFAVPLSKLPEGTYSAEVKVVSERNDVPSDELLKTAPVVKTVKLSVP